MSYVKSLKDVLKDKDLTLFNRLHEIESLAKGVLTYTASKFPYYTPHDFTHSSNVEENLNWLIPDSKKPDLNSHEIFFLLIAAWLHDWGMVGSADEIAEEIRTTHHIRTEEKFEKSHGTIRLSITEGRVVGRICRGHRKEDLLESRYDELFFQSNIKIRVRFLAAILRIADECDVAANRVPEIIYYSLSPKGTSDEEFRKQLSITGIGQPEPYKLQLSGVARDPKGVKALEEVRKKIQNEVNNVKTILAKEDINLEYVGLTVDTRGFINEPISFTLDREKIVNLLIGQNLYNRVDACVRELLQNSIDACRLRLYLEKDYTPFIKIYFSDGKICVEDNGIGMNFDTASRFLSNVGASFFISKKFKDMKLGKKKFDPISRFGIGILSCFLVSDKVVIETLKEGGSPCKFIIDDLNEGWRYEACEREDFGTKVTLSLNEAGKKLNLRDSLQHYARAVKIPIQIINAKTGDKKELEQQWDHRILREVIEKKGLNWPEKSLEPTYETTIRTKGLEVKYYHLNQRCPISNYFVSYQGIYVGDFEFCNSVSEKLMALVNCTEDIVDLSVSRDRFVLNEKYHIFIGSLYENFFHLIDEHYHKRIKDKELTELDKCIEFAEVSNGLFQNPSIMSLEAETESEVLSGFLSKIVFPVVKRNGLEFLTGQEIRSATPQRILELIMSFSEVMEDSYIRNFLTFFESYYKETLLKDDVLIVNIGPIVMFLDSKAENFDTDFGFWCRQKNVKHALLGFQELMAQKKFPITPTSIDHLLPGKSHFSELPPELRSMSLLLKAPKFSNLTSSNPSHREAIRLLSICEMYSCDKHIKNIFNKELEDALKPLDLGNPCELEASGEFLFDSADLVIKAILEKSELVLSNERIRSLIKKYFACLAAFFHTGLNANMTASLLQMTLFESTILTLLQHEGVYRPLNERAGPLLRWTESRY